MAQMLLINPRKRRTVKAKRRASPARKTASRKTVRRRRPAVAAYAPNPIAKSVRRKVRRASVKTKRAIRRRRNPIGGMGKLNMRGITDMLKTALIGGAGAVSVDLLMAQVNKWLPASLQPSATPGANSAVKAALTVFLGTALAKSTGGMSSKMAAGALAVQAADVVRYALAKYMPAVPVAPADGVSGIGYAVPAYVTQGTNRVGPAMNGVSVARRGSGPLLNAFTTGGQLLSGTNRAAQREARVR